MFSKVSFSILVLFLLILVIGLLTLLQIAMISARKSLIEDEAAQGKRRAQRTLKILESRDLCVSTLQVLLTLMTVFLGAFAGVSLVGLLSLLFADIAHAGALALGVIVLIVSFALFVLGLLVPRRLAFVNPEFWTIAFGGPVYALSRLMMPLIRAVNWCTEKLLRSFGIEAPIEAPVSEEDIKDMIEQGTETGIFEKAEEAMMTKVLRLGDRLVNSLMTPRNDIVWIDVDDPIEVSWREMTASRHSYFPVCRGSIDQLVGIVSAKEIWPLIAHGQTVQLQDLVRAPLLIPGTVTALRLLDRFKSTASEVALVIDEYGGIDGVITLVDLVEAILGDLSAEEEGEGAEIVERADGSYLVDAQLLLDELKERFEIKTLPGEEEGGFYSVGGFILQQLGHIPEVAEHFECAGFRFEVVDMDGKRIDKVLLSPVSPLAPDGEDKEAVPGD